MTAPRRIANRVILLLCMKLTIPRDDCMYRRLFASATAAYPIAGIAIDKDNIRAHGQDENVGMESFYRGNELFYSYLKMLTC
jgi:hypothetical protein